MNFNNNYEQGGRRDEEEESKYFLLIGKLAKRDNEASLVGKPVQVSKPIAHHLLQTYASRTFNVNEQSQKKIQRVDNNGHNNFDLLQNSLQQRFVPSKNLNFNVTSSQPDDHCSLSKKRKVAPPSLHPDSSWFNDDDEDDFHDAMDHNPLGPPEINFQKVPNIKRPISHEDTESESSMNVTDINHLLKGTVGMFAGLCHDKSQGDINNNLTSHDGAVPSTFSTVFSPERTKPVCRCSECRLALTKN